MGINSIKEAVRMALDEAHLAEGKGSYGVGGVMINTRDGSIIKTMQNTVITDGRLIDPTAHGERQLVDWYYAQEDRTSLPHPRDVVIVISLDPCCMCAGSILAGGFKAIISAMDDKAGINYCSPDKTLPKSSGINRSRCLKEG